jgi:hypothetical protein
MQDTRLVQCESQPRELSQRCFTEVMAQAVQEQAEPVRVLDQNGIECCDSR